MFFILKSRIAWIFWFNFWFFWQKSIFLCPERVSSGPNMSFILDMIFIFKKIWGKIWQKIWDLRKIWRKIMSYFPSDFAYTIWYLSIFIVLNFILILIFLKYGEKYGISIWREFVIFSSYLDQMKRTHLNLIQLNSESILAQFCLNFNTILTQYQSTNVCSIMN